MLYSHASIPCTSNVPTFCDIPLNISPLTGLPRHLSIPLTGTPRRYLPSREIPVYSAAFPSSRAGIWYVLKKWRSRDDVTRTCKWIWRQWGRLRLRQNKPLPPATLLQQRQHINTNKRVTSTWHHLGVKISKRSCLIITYFLIYDGVKCSGYLNLSLASHDSYAE